MTDNMDSNGQALGGNGSQPAPSGAASPNSAVDISAVLDQLRATNERLERIERGGQSVKDKRIAGLQGDIDGFKSQLAELKELMAGGLSETAALRLMSAQQPASPQNQPPPIGNPQGSGDSIDVASVISAMNLNAADPDVIRLLREERNASKLVTDLANIARQRSQPQTPPPPGQQMPIPGGSASGETLDSITAELEKLMLNPVQNIGKIKELRARQAAMLK